MTENKSKQAPLSDLAFDWVTIIQHKSKALRAYEQYMQDAQQANSPECLELMRQIYEQDANHVREATRHLMEVLREGRMGPETRQSQGQASQGESGQRMREGGARPGGMSQGSAGGGMREGGARSGGVTQGQGEAGRMREGATRSSESEQGQMGQAAGRQSEMQQSQMEEREAGPGQQRRPRSS